jgi:putative ABC transport system permease protein
VVAEVSLSLVLLAGAGLLLRSFVLLQGVPPGFLAPPERVVTLQISPSAVKYADEPAGLAFYRRLLESVGNAPGVEAAALADSLPPDRQVDADTYVVEGQDPARANPAVTVPVVSAGYFRTLGIPLLRGRYFSEDDTPSSPPVTIVSEAMARRCFGDEDPIGRRIKQSGPELTQNPYREIVGVVGDTKYSGLDTGPEAAYYLPYTQSFNPSQNLVVRAGTGAAALVPSLEAAIRAVSPPPASGRCWWRPSPRSRCSWPRSASTASSRSRWPSAATRSACAWPSAPGAGTCCAW